MKNSFCILAVLIIALTVIINACKHEIPEGITGGSPTPVPGGTGEVCFESQILPIFQSNCAKSGCHDAATHQDGYVFDSYANIIKKDVRPGNAANSKVYKVLFETGDKKMPRPPVLSLPARSNAIGLFESSTTNGSCFRWNVIGTMSSTDWGWRTSSSVPVRLTQVPIKWRAKHSPLLDRSSGGRNRRNRRCQWPTIRWR